MASLCFKKYSKYESYLTEVCGKVAKNLPDVGPYLRQTGGDRFSPSKEWPSSDGTPKTDIFGGADYRIFNDLIIKIKKKYNLDKKKINIYK